MYVQLGVVNMSDSISSIHRNSSSPSSEDDDSSKSSSSTPSDSFDDSDYYTVKMIFLH